VVWRLLAPLVTWAYNAPVSEWIRASRWAVAVLEVFHLFGLIFLLGSVFMIGLRSFGVAMQRDHVEEVVRKLAPATLGGLVLMTVTGALIFSSGATRYVDNKPFQVKMVFYLLALSVQCAMYVLALRKKKEEPRRLDPIWMALGGLAVLLWFGVGLAGRAIAFI
jgi:cytochrome bd-type quinol oxidase subunit 2